MDLAFKNHMYSNISIITNLPDDSLYLIFKKLDSEHDRESFALTCHCFFDVLASRCRSLKLGCSHHRLNCAYNANVYTLLKRYPHLDSLSLDGCVRVSDLSLSKLQISGSKLYSLNLSNCSYISDFGITSVASCFPLLCIIHLSKCSISDIGLEILSKSCKYLEVVDLSWCENITDHGIWSLNQNCPQVRALNVCGCVKVVGLADFKANQFAFDSKGVAGILSGGGLRHLKFLNFERCYFVEDDAVLTISKGCPLLCEWNLSFCYKIGISGWESIGLYAQNLETLNVSYCDNLCSRGLTALYDGCQRLSVLYINKCLKIFESQIQDFKNRNVLIMQEVSSTIVPTWAFI